jgi:energy-coupling factor transport system ATP-binding protein
LIRINNVTWRYAGNENTGGLNNVSLTIKKGECIVLVGKSGCGKSTLGKVINGLIPHFQEGNMTGQVLLEGTDTRQLDLHEIGRKVGSVFQDPRSQFFTTNTLDEAAFGCQNLGICRDEIWRRLEDSFSSLNALALANRDIFSLSSGEKQKAAIVASRTGQPEVYVLDEPSANLDMRATNQLRETLRKLKESGATLIVAEHRMHYLSGIADRFIFMENGEIAAIYGAAEMEAMPQETLYSMGLRAIHLDSIKPAALEKVSFSTGNELRVENLYFCYKGKRSAAPNEDAVHNICFSAHTRELIGIVGHNGAGKTTLSRLLTGLATEKSGSVFLDKKQLAPKKRIGNVYFVLQDSDYQLFSATVKEELMLGNEASKDLEEKCFQIAQQLGIEDYMDQHPAALSRGQKQRLTIACALLSNAPILIFDEPTSGLDYISMKQVAMLLRSISDTGRMVLTISHDYEFLLHTCNRILCMEQGHLTDDFKLNNDTCSKLLAFMREAKGGKESGMQHTTTTKQHQRGTA